MRAWSALLLCAAAQSQLLVVEALPTTAERDNSGGNAVAHEHGSTMTASALSRVRTPVHVADKIRTGDNPNIETAYMRGVHGTGRRLLFSGTENKLDKKALAERLERISKRIEQLQAKQNAKTGPKGIASSLTGSSFGSSFGAAGGSSALAGSSFGSSSFGAGRSSRPPSFGGSSFGSAFDSAAAKSSMDGLDASAFAGPDSQLGKLLAEHRRKRKAARAGRASPYETINIDSTSK